MKRLLLACLAVLAAACDRGGSSHSADADEQWEAIDVSVAPVEADEERVGQLAYRGGVELSADSRMFVGLSSLEVLDGGLVVATSDEADWIMGDLVLDERGYLTGFANARAAFMRNERGRVIREKAQGDSEGLAQLPDGRFAVSFERANIIRIYDLNRDGPFGAAIMGPRLAGVAHLPRNASLEALAAFDNALITAAEGGESSTTPLWVAPLDARTPVAPRFTYPLSDGFSLTGMDRLPDGDFVALERFYAPVVGPRARITRFAAPSGEGGAIEPEVVATLEPPFPVDNFESVSAVRTSGGATRIYIISDNNNSARQRTLLLAFDIVEEREN